MNLNDIKHRKVIAFFIEAIDKDDIKILCILFEVEMFLGFQKTYIKSSLISSNASLIASDCEGSLDFAKYMYPSR